MTTAAAVATSFSAVGPPPHLQQVTTETPLQEPSAGTGTPYPLTPLSLETNPGESESVRATKIAHDPPLQMCSTAGALMADEPPAYAAAPRAVEVSVDAEARPYLVSDAAEIRDSLLSLVGDRVAAAGLRLRGVRISLKRSQEDDWQEVVFRVFVDANMAQGIALWDSIGRAIDRWRARLPARSQRFLDEQMGVFVEWA